MSLTPYNPSIIERALRIAAVAHRTQMRKGGNIPYIIHPCAVALKLTYHHFPDTVIAAALTHDVLEDTDVPESELRTQLGDEVTDMVFAVTEDKTLAWKERKTAYIASVRAGGDGAKAISAADKIHNLESMLIEYQKCGSALWDHFPGGKEMRVRFHEDLLTMLRDTWEHPLVDEYVNTLELFKRNT